MPLCGHRLAAVTILWSAVVVAYVGCQKPSSVTKRHDVYIAGLFPFTPVDFPETRTGRGVMPAVKLAVEHINDSPTVLRNYRLHMWWNDTQVSDDVFLYQVLR
jgi:gamma-aminobutyric acid type B receptor